MGMTLIAQVRRSRSWLISARPGTGTLASTGAARLMTQPKTVLQGSRFSSRLTCATFVLMAALPTDFRWLFWEKDLASLDSETDADYILARILEFGTMVEVRWAIATFGLDRIHRFFREVGHPELSDRTIHFWRAVFKAENEQWASPPAWRKSSIAHWVG